MQIIHTSFKKRKPKKQAGWKQREEEYAAWLKQHGIDPTAKKKRDTSMETYTGHKDPFRRETAKIPSLPFTGAPCTKPQQQVYTGTLIKGIATMHKSNAIPIISDEQAIEVARMRRG